MNVTLKFKNLIKLSALVFVLSSLIGCRAGKTESSLAHHGKSTKYHGSFYLDRYEMYTLKNFHVRLNGSWYDFILPGDEQLGEGLIFIRFEGRSEGAVAKSVFYENLTIHCKDKPNEISFQLDLVQENNSDSFISGPIKNPCLNNGGIFKITSKGELSSDKEELAIATLEYLFTKDLNSGGPRYKYSNNNMFFPGNIYPSIWNYKAKY